VDARRARLCWRATRRARTLLLALRALVVAIVTRARAPRRVVTDGRSAARGREELPHMGE
jgi:hypothetical protein